MKYVLVLRACKFNMNSYNGFVWPKKGRVEAPDWNPEPVCGGGLHGLLWGEGDASLIEGCIWQVVRVLTADIVDLGGKVKFPAGVVIYTGTREGATQLIYNRAPNGTVVHYLSITGGDRATLTGGYMATLTGGDGATLTGGYGATLTGGNDATLTGGDGATLTGGYMATLTGGYMATLTGGDGATLTWRVFDGQRFRLYTVYVGENGILPGVPYQFIYGQVKEVAK